MEPVSTAVSFPSIRARSVRLFSWLLWLASFAFLALLASFLLNAVEAWVALLVSLNAPPWVVPAGVIAFFAVPAAVAVWAYRAYTRSWHDRLFATWGGRPPARAHARVRGLRRSAGERELGRRCDYLTALLATPEWSGSNIAPPENDAAAYKLSAERVFAAIERDVSGRAIVTGLAVGLSRTRAIDLIAIAAAALELQLHVLARLGKKPSPAMWRELWKRTTASMFLNWYVSREQALELSLAIKKAGLGLQAAAAASEELLEQLADVDWEDSLDDLVGDNSGVLRAAKAGAEAVFRSGGMLIGIGAEGLRQIAGVLHRNADELIEGVLAAGILYYHGMAIAADCLALDRMHRTAPEMNRSVGQGISAATAVAGALVRRHVRQLRTAMRQRRAEALAALRSKTAGATRQGWARMRNLAGRRQQFRPPA